MTALRCCSVVTVAALLCAMMSAAGSCSALLAER